MSTNKRTYILWYIILIRRSTKIIDDQNLVNEFEQKKNHKFFHVCFQSTEIRTKLIMKILLRNANKWKKLTIFDVCFQSGEIPKTFDDENLVNEFQQIKNHKFFDVSFQSAEISTKLTMNILLRNANNWKNLHSLIFNSNQEKYLKHRG